MPIQRLYSLLEDSPVTFDDNDITITLADGTDVTKLKNSFDELGYTGSDSVFSKKPFVFRNGLASWKNQVFYTDAEDIFEYVDTKFKLPVNVLFIDYEGSITQESIEADDETSEQSEESLVEEQRKLRIKQFTSELDIYKKLNIFIEFRKLLSSLSDHAIPDAGLAKGSQKVIILVKGEDGGSKHEISTTIDYPDLMSALEGANLDENLSSLKKLNQCIKLDDQQDKERKNCLRSALDAIIEKSSDSDDLFRFLLSNIHKLHKTYTVHHDLFLSDFTVNKIIQEINTKDLDYTGKINEITSSAQTKALAIPGAMIAISAVMKVEDFVTAVGVVVALFLTCIVIDRSLSIYNSSFAHLEKQIKDVFSRYMVLNENSDIRKQAKDTESDLLEMTEKAMSGVTFVKRVIWFVWGFSILFVAAKLLYSSPDKGSDMISTNPSTTMIETPTDSTKPLSKDVETGKVTLPEDNTTGTK